MCKFPSLSAAAGAVDAIQDKVEDVQEQAEQLKDEAEDLKDEMTPLAKSLTGFTPTQLKIMVFGAFWRKYIAPGILVTVLALPMFIWNKDCESDLYHLHLYIPSFVLTHHM